MSLQLSDYDYALPAELIAQRPLPERDASRMMVLHRQARQIEHRSFRDLPEYLAPGDLLVLNNTRVLPARRYSDDGKIEFLFIEKLSTARWKCLVQPGRKMRVGSVTAISGVGARVEEVCPEGERIVQLESETDILRDGVIPLPPYMKRESDAEDLERYQTSFAAVPGAVAAPTAGLHFTPAMLARIPHAFVTLHVGPGTFRPVTSENIVEHKMHAERFAISSRASAAINAAARVVAVGTTTVRVLQAAERIDGRLVAQNGATDLFIYPPRPIDRVDALLTNFHLPRSSLLMLVSAFAGREFVLASYAEAIRERYRFFSYGDCMLIV
ncbi:MAG: tRNA preQ1(34) S-adenosylmethionine ribosyltransferase-isomerase QueA [Chthoniobacterales bacterium]